MHESDLSNSPVSLKDLQKSLAKFTLDFDNAEIHDLSKELLGFISKSSSKFKSEEKLSELKAELDADKKGNPDR